MFLCVLSVNEKGSDVPLFFDRLRKQMKGIIIVVCVAFALGLLYVGEGFFNPSSSIPVVAQVNGDSISSLELDRRDMSIVKLRRPAGPAGHSGARSRSAV